MLLKKKEYQNRKNKKNLEGTAVVRVSKENETKDGSPTQQLNMIKNWVKRQKERTGKTYKITNFIVEDGKSGRYQNTHRRKEILHLAELVKMGAIDFIVKERLDRFSRDEVLNIQIMRDARKNNVELHEVNYGQFNPNDRGQRMAWKFRNIEAGEYSEEVSENVARKHRSAMVFNGKDASPCPVIGLDLHPRYVGIYTINKNELKIFEDIANKFIELGYNREGTIRYCLEKGYRTKEWWTKEKNKDGERIPPRKMGGLSFDWRSLLNLLGNPKIRGKNSFFDNWNQFPEKQDKEGWVEWEYKHFRNHGPLFGEEFFKKIDQGLQKVEYNSRANEFLLSGILFASDGSRYSGEASKSGKNPYYRNNKHNKRFSAKQLHKLVFDRLKDLIKKNGLLESVVSDIEKHPTLGLPKFENERKKIKKDMAEYQDSLESLSRPLKMSDLKNRDNYAEVFEAVLEEKRKCKEEIQSLGEKLYHLNEQENNFKESMKGDKFKKFAKQLLNNLKTLEPLELKGLIRTLIPRAVIVLGDKEHTLELIYNLDTSPDLSNERPGDFFCGDKGLLSRLQSKRYMQDQTQTAVSNDRGVEDKKWSLSANGRRHPKVVEPVLTTSQEVGICWGKGISR